MKTVIVDKKISYPGYLAEVIILYKNISGLDDPSVVIVVHRNALDLDHGPVIVVLNIRIVIITGVIANIYTGYGYIYNTGSSEIGVIIEVEFSVRKNGELYTVFYKYERIIVSVSH